MSTVTETRPASRPSPAPSAAHPEWRWSFGGVLRSELLKLFTLRSTYWLLGLMIAGFTALSVVFFATYPVAEHGRGTISASTYLMATLAGQMLMVVLGALITSGEYSTGAIRSTLAATPHRGPVLAAKAIVAAVVAVAISLVSIGVSILASMPLWGRTGAPVFGDALTRGVGGATLYLVCLTLIGVGLGALIRATPGAITAGLGLILVVPMVLTGFLGSFEWAQTLYKFMPDAQFGPLLSSPMWQSVDGNLAGYQSGLVLLGWTVLALGAGYWRLRKSDA